ncbi:MAG: zinc-dependent alcohol dehydrogenase family protein [Steroidobacteraceae bacterium]
MCLQRTHQPLVQEWRELPEPGAREVLLAVRACGVCRTDLHVIDGELPDQPLPIVPGHEIVGEVIRRGSAVAWPVGTRLGVPWLGHTCGACEFCLSGRENLCDEARFTGYQIDGGYASHVLADARYCFELPPAIDDVHAAPLLCAGLIGYRAWRMAGECRRLGIYGFGAAAHIVAQVALAQGQEVYAFTRPGDAQAQAFATRMGVHWAGDSNLPPPVKLEAAIVFATPGELIPQALAGLRKGGTLVCGGIHMSDIPAFPYALLWGERTIRSVANLTRRDGIEFLELAAKLRIRTHVETFPLDQANTALDRLRNGQLSGAAVLVP